jgi:hypothetical protein
MKTVESENNRYISILKEVHTKISPLIAPQVQPPTNSSSSAATSGKTLLEKTGNDDAALANGKTAGVSE